MKNEYLLTIAIVSLNAVAMIDKTLKSLNDQPREQVCEVLFIDGGSKDGTVDKIHEFCETSAFFCRLFSEVDQGIYDAMNKAVKLAFGTYVYFLNCGDCFYENDTLSKIIKFLDNKDIYYGDVICGNKQTHHPLRLSNVFFLREHMINSQAIVAKTELIKQYPFDVSLKLTADRDWLLNCYRHNKSYQYINITIAFYDTTGASSNKELLYKDVKAFVLKNFGILGVVFIKTKRLLGTILRFIRVLFCHHLNM